MTFGSLFSGIGGLDLGLERAGLQCRWQCEIDPYAVKVLEKHWPDVKRYGDITKITGDELEPVDLICGGFPCQDLSQAGKRAGIEGTRSGLWFEYARIIGVVRPRYVLIENVPGLLVPGAMRRVVGELAGLGYVGSWRSLRASEFGASHLRKRVFIVAYSNGSGLETRDQFTIATGSARREFGGGRSPLAYRNGGRREVEWSGGLFDGERTARGYDAYGCDTDVAHAASELHDGAGIAGPGRRRQPANGDRELAHAISTRLEERPSVGGDVHAQCATAQRARGEVADAAGRNGAGGMRADGREILRRHVAGERDVISGGNIPRFAPGPSDSRWPRILRERPDLAPALESAFRRVADGLPNRLHGDPMSNRTKRLGRLGNAVVPDCAEWVAERILEFEEQQCR